MTIRFKDKSNEKFCRQCQLPALFLTVDEAAVLRQSSAREIYRLVEDGQIHFEEIEHGKLLVCHSSLARAEKENDFTIRKDQQF